MRKIVITSLAAALCATALPASAQTSPALAQALGNEDAQNAPAPRSRARGGDNPDRRICVSEQVSESRMRRRICRTAREWEARGGLEDDR